MAEDEKKERETSSLDLSSHKCHCRMGVDLPITSSKPGVSISFSTLPGTRDDPASRRRFLGCYRTESRVERMGSPLFFLFSISTVEKPMQADFDAFALSLAVGQGRHRGGGQLVFSEHLT